MRSYGYNDQHIVSNKPGRQKVAIAFAVLFLAGMWLALDYKLLFGADWISPTYDNPDWRTNEGELHTFGAWDIETHIWKTEYIMENFPNFHWNPYWYLGMPLLKYYQVGFYAVHALFIMLTGMSAAKSATMLVIFGHLLATLLTFFLCLKVSNRVWVSALSSSFLLANTFMSLRSYGWEPISVVFMFLYPLGLLLFLKEPLRPMRFWMVIVLGISYLAHPLIWFSLLMFMGIYLFSIAIRTDQAENARNSGYMWQYFSAAILSMLVGAVQFLPQMSYVQATSGAHMGVKYLPFYQVPFNIINLWDFFFDAGNLKGPGPVIMIAALFLVVYGLGKTRTRLMKNELIVGLSLTLFLMVLFYYIELYNVFPMNLLRSIQYHRIIPEFVITAAVLIAAMSNIVTTARLKAFNYAMLIGFVAASSIIIYNIQGKWQTTDDISQQPEFLYDDIPGRISFPYTDQSLSVRNSFTEVPQAYGYYEQGITNAYSDEIFSVSSGYHDAENTLLYLKATNVGRLYINNEEGRRDMIMRARLDGLAEFVDTGGRYSYFEIPLDDPDMVEAVSLAGADKVKALDLGCREMYQETYCGSVGEEFVTRDKDEAAYLQAYLELLSEEIISSADYSMINPDFYEISVRNATIDTGVVVKMTYDTDFHAFVNGREVKIERFGPDFMLITPMAEGDYRIELRYKLNNYAMLGAIVSLLTITGLGLYSWRPFSLAKPFASGDMYG